MKLRQYADDDAQAKVSNGSANDEDCYLVRILPAATGAAQQTWKYDIKDAVRHISNFLGEKRL